MDEVPHYSKRLYSFDNGPQRVTYQQAVAYIGSHEKLWHAIESGHAEDLWS